MEQEVCTHCGETGALTNLPALGHDYAAVVTEPTCETPGFTTHTCGRCGDHFTDSYIAPTGHTYGDGVVTREPTCTREGEMTYTCSCGKTHTEPIAKLAHSYVPQIVEPDVHRSLATRPMSARTAATGRRATMSASWAMTGTPERSCRPRA